MHRSSAVIRSWSRAGAVGAVDPVAGVVRRVG
jgi:hypothetical protein